MKKIIYPVIYLGLLLLISCSSWKVQNDVSKLTSNQWDLVSISGKVLILDPGPMTKMYCDDSPETDFLSVVRKTTGYKITGSELVLLNGTTELMKFISKN